MPRPLLEIGGSVEPEIRCDDAKPLRADGCLDLGWRPDVELPFLALGICVERRVEAASGILHIAQHPGGRFARDASVQRLACRRMRFAIEREQRGIVVEHFLEVRYAPIAIDGVAKETTSELVVEPAFGHGSQRASDHPQRVEVGRLRRGCASPLRQQELEIARVRKLRGLAEAARLGVEALLERLPCSLKHARGAACRRPRPAARSAPALRRRPRPATDVGGMVAVVGRDATQHVLECRHAETRLAREIGADEDRQMRLGREERGQRPSAGTPRRELMDELIDLVEIGSFLAVDFDVDVELVHELGRVGILERLVCHDVAPVARRIAYRDEKRLPAGARHLERRTVPCLPSHGVTRVL